MKSFVPIALVLGLAACASVPAEPAPEDRAQLASELGDRVAAGAPVDCVAQHDLRGNRSVGESYILFDGWRDSLYINTPLAGCPALSPGRTLITRSYNSRLCKGDIVEVRDLTSGISYGSCALGQFQKYEKK